MFLILHPHDSGKFIVNVPFVLQSHDSGKFIVDALLVLLCTPEPDDPQDAEVAQMYKSNKEEFLQTARFWTEMYAQVKEEGASAQDAAVQRVCGMGFDEAAVRAALEKHAWDENAAVNALLGAM